MVVKAISDKATFEPGDDDQNVAEQAEKFVFSERFRSFTNIDKRLMDFLEEKGLLERFFTKSLECHPEDYIMRIIQDGDPGFLITNLLHCGIDQKIPWAAIHREWGSRIGYLQEPF